MAGADSFTLQPLTADETSGFFADAFDILCDVFVESSAVHVALNVKMEPYREYFLPHFRSMVSENLSLVAIDKEVGKPVGVIVGCDYFPSEEDGSEHSERPQWIAPLYELLDDLSAEYRNQKPRLPGQVVLVDMAAVSPGYGGRGIYQAMRVAFHARAASAGFDRVIGELSSAATQAVCIERFHHRTVSEIAFADFQYQGQRPFASIKEPPTITLVEGRLDV